MFNLRKRIRYFWQRHTRGWDDSELWNLDYTIAKFILPRLMAFRSMHRLGCPPELSEKDWEEALDKMIRGFDLTIIEFEESDIDNGEEQQLDEGLELFAKWFRYLWD